MAKSQILDTDRLLDAVAMRTMDSLDDILAEVRDCISRRAFELFEADCRDCAHDLDDWLTAERELFWRPSARITERDGRLDLRIAMPGTLPEDVDLRVTSHQVLVMSQEPSRGASAGEVSLQLDEMPRGRAFRVFEFDSPLNPASARARLRDGMLSVEVALAADVEQPTRVEVAA